MEQSSNTLLIYGVRLLCVIFFINSSVSWKTTWKSLVTFLALLGSFILLKPSRNNVKGKPKEKTRDIINDLYPPMTSANQELQAAQAIYKLVSYDAENTQSLENFETVKQNSDCVFARKAKLWGSPFWNKGMSIEENIYRMLPMFLKFTIVCASQRLDGFLIELPGHIYGQNIEVFSGALRDVLTAISDQDPAGYHCMNKSFIGKRGWVFEFNKITFFITTFAPFYPESHPRYGFGNENCYILFQPELSFVFHDLPPDSPETKWENPKTVRDKIRVAFKSAGRPYSIPKSVYSPMALEMVRPVNDNDPVIEWWKK